MLKCIKSVILKRKPTTFLLEKILLKTLETKTILSTRTKDSSKGIDQQLISDAVFVMSFIHLRAWGFHS